jgi:hypothetical protein
LRCLRVVKERGLLRLERTGRLEPLVLVASPGCRASDEMAAFGDRTQVVAQLSVRPLVLSEHCHAIDHSTSWN